VRSVLTEQIFLATTDHPFITKLLHSFTSAERLFMVMEYCPGGELWTLIKRQPNERLNEEQIRFYAAEVLIVLEFVHSKGYIYRDLKPENILIHTDGHIRVADFGLSKQADTIPEMKVKQGGGSFLKTTKSRSLLDFRQGSVIRTNSLVGSVHYLAPEVLSIRGSYNVMADWWAFGILLYDMFYGGPPFQGRCNEEVMMKILQGEYRFYESLPISPELKSLIKGLLKRDPKKRICAKRGANDLKKHPFFATIQWGLLRNATPPIMPVIDNPEDASNFDTDEEFDDEEEDEFRFFSELPECHDLLTPEEQKRFDGFEFTRKSFAQSIVGPINSPMTRARSQSVQTVEEKKKRRSREKQTASGIRRTRSEIDEKFLSEAEASHSFPGTVFGIESDFPILEDVPISMNECFSPSPEINTRKLHLKRKKKKRRKSRTKEKKVKEGANSKPPPKVEMLDTNGHVDSPYPIRRKNRWQPDDESFIDLRADNPLFTSKAVKQKPKRKNSATKLKPVIY